MSRLERVLDIVGRMDPIEFADFCAATGATEDRVVGSLRARRAELFDVVLTDTERKIEAIRALRNAMGLMLKEAKDVIDGGPGTVLLRRKPREEAEAFAAHFEADRVGVTIRPAA